MLDRLVWAEINLKNYAYNFKAVRKLTGPKVKIMAVVKANAYGHGIVEISKEVTKLGAKYLGVACLGEAKQIRESGNKLPILILGCIDANSIPLMLSLNITSNVMDEQVLKILDRKARKKGVLAKIHVKIDTGMHRIGLLPEQAIRFIPKIQNYKNIFLEGIFTHFASSDEKNLDFTYKQLSIFNQVLQKLAQRGIAHRLIHASNSAATLRVQNSHFDMVRPGIILYGLPPSSEFTLPFSPKPVLSLKTKIVQLKKIGKGETVGYGRAYKAAKSTLVAALPVGYADGFRRSPTNWGYVLVKGLKASILGRVSMDQTTIDATGIPDVKIEDEVVLIGQQGKEEINTEEVGERIGTINYEVVSSFSDRVSRVYIR